MSLRTVDGCGREIKKVITEVCPVGCNPDVCPDPGLIHDNKRAEEVRQENIGKEICFQEKVLSCKWKKHYICQYAIEDLYLRLIGKLQ